MIASEQEGLSPNPLPALEEQFGVHLPDLGDEPLRTLTNTHSNMLTAMYMYRQTADQVAERGLPQGVRRGEVDPRLAPLLLGSVHGAHGVFLLDWALYELIDGATPEGGTLSHNQLAALAIANTTNAVDPHFSADAINRVNEVYFNSSVAFLPEAGLATLFAQGEVTNLVVGAHLGKMTEGVMGRIRIKELCSGSQTNHWNIIALGVQAIGIEGMDVTITDLKPPPLPNIGDAEFLCMNSEAYSLLEDLPELLPANRYHLFYEAYGFCSLWQTGDGKLGADWRPQDIRLTRVGDQWYKSYYRLKVDEWSPKQRELIEALRTGIPLAYDETDPLVARSGDQRSGRYFC